MYFQPHKTGACNYMLIWVHECQNACRFLFGCDVIVFLALSCFTGRTLAPFFHRLNLIANLVSEKPMAASSLTKKFGRKLFRRLAAAGFSLSILAIKFDV
jgi:hypothetical protein